jgi:hypothetical protein
MIRAPVLILLLVALSGTLRAQQELPPPNVAFFGALETSRTDFSGLNAEEDVDGTRLRAGLWLNDVTFGRWKLGVEGAYNRLGDSALRDRSQRPATGQEQNTISINGNPPVTVTETTDRERDVGGLEFGFRLHDSELFHLRAGGYLYSYRNRQDTTLEFTNANGGSITNDLTPESESTSTLAPYAGAGFAFPLTDQLRLTTDLSVYWIESEPLDSLSVGLQYRSE